MSPATALKYFTIPEYVNLKTSGIDRPKLQKVYLANVPIRINRLAISTVRTTKSVTVFNQDQNINCRRANDFF